MNKAAELTLESLRAHYAAAGPYYRDALIAACRKAPPPFGTKKYAKIYRDVAKDPNWMAMSLIQNAQGEGEGSEHLWDLAASTPDPRVAAHVKAHAIDESRHAKAYLAMLDLTFPDVVDEAHDPHDLFRLAAFEINPHAHGIQTDKIFPRQGSVDDRHMRVVRFHVGVSEVASCEQSCPERLEVAGADRTPGNFVVLSGMFVAKDSNRAGAIAVADGKLAGNCY